MLGDGTFSPRAYDRFALQQLPFAKEAREVCYRVDSGAAGIGQNAECRVPFDCVGIIGGCRTVCRRDPGRVQSRPLVRL